MKMGLGDGVDAIEVCCNCVANGERWGSEKNKIDTSESVPSLEGFDKFGSAVVVYLSFICRYMQTRRMEL